MESGSNTPDKKRVLPVRERLPDTREAITAKFVLPSAVERVVVDESGHASTVKDDFVGYMTVGLYDDGRPGEIFFKAGKEGDEARIYDALMISMSIGLQYGVPIEVFIDKLEYMRFIPNGITSNPDIPLAKSVPDYIAKWLKRKFVKDGESEDA